jgi:hypothetical protein
MEFVLPIFSLFDRCVPVQNIFCKIFRIYVKDIYFFVLSGAVIKILGGCIS